MIDTAALREKVLDLAIRGKLVPQDPTDEPASVLLERIHEQKLQMVREGKLKAKDVKDDTIIFKGDDNCYYEKYSDGSVKNIQDEIPFDLPVGWSWERLSNLAAFSGGKTPSTSNRDYWGGNVLWVTSKDMKSKYIDSSLLMISEKSLEQMQLYPENTLLLVTRSGILRHTIPVAILKKPATINQDLKAIMPYALNLGEYIYICIKGMESRLILEYTKAGATVENINFDAFQKILLPIPPENQIQRIVLAVNKVDEIIVKLKIDQDDLIDIIGKTKSKILELAIQGKLVPQDENDEPANVLLERIRTERKAKLGKKYVESYIFKGDDNCYYEKVGNTSKKISEEMPFDLPFGWCWITLKEIATITSGKTPKNEQITDLGNIPYFKVGDMNLSGNEIFMEVVQYYVNDCYTGITFPKNSFIFPKNGGALLTNKKRILKQESLVDLNTGVLIPSSAVNNEFMFYLFSTVDFTKNYKGSTIPTIDNEMIGNIVFALPPIEEQSRIVQKIKAIMSILKGGD